MASWTSSELGARSSVRSSTSPRAGWPSSSVRARRHGWRRTARPLGQPAGRVGRSKGLLGGGHVAFIWNIAESLRGPFKPAEYGSVVLPFTVLRRMDAVLADTKAKVLAVKDRRWAAGSAAGPWRCRTPPGGSSTTPASSTSPKAGGRPQRPLRQNLGAYLAGFSPNVRDIFERGSSSTRR